MIVDHSITRAEIRKLYPKELNPYFFRKVRRRPNPIKTMKWSPSNTKIKQHKQSLIRR
jgi:hypothetical protein